MITKSEADRIATAITAARPEWSHAQIMGVLGKESIREKRCYADTFHAMLAVALDPKTKQPTRVLEAGPWWGVGAALNEPINTTSLLPKPDFESGCHICLRPALGHDDTDHTFERPARVPMPEHIRQIANAATTQEEQ